MGGGGGGGGAVAYASRVAADGEVPRGVHAPVVVAHEAVHGVLEGADVGAAGDEGLGVVCGCLRGAVFVDVAAEAAWRGRWVSVCAHYVCEIMRYAAG